MPLNSVKTIAKPVIRFFLILMSVLIGFCSDSYAQLCTGSLGDPVVKIDFGAGTAAHAGALAAGTTNYTYSTADFPIDGSYTVENRTTGNIWWNTTDHTGDSGGYMMVVNAATAKTDYFYKSTVTGLCPGTTFEFAAWVANLLRSSDISPPNITFTISTTAGVVLATYNTGSIPLTPNGLVWKQFGTYFTTPAGVSDVVIQMTNNSNGGAPANDLALDDITFRPCGPMLTSSFISGNSSSLSETACSGSNLSYQLNSTVVSNSYVNPVYQWQLNTGSAWTNITGATSTSYTVNFPSATAGIYKYRMITSEAANAGSTNCQVASNELTLTIGESPTAAFTIGGTTTACLTSAVSFTNASTSPTLAITKWNWDFGDGQTDPTASPTHTYSTYGDYNVALTVTNSGGCTSTSTQRIHIAAKLLADFTAPTQSCPNVPVNFTDNSSTADGTIVKWVWNAGDGSANVTHTDNSPFTYTYTQSGTFKPQLQVTSAAGCTSDITQKSIVILPPTTPDFILPDVCQNDTYAQFTDATVISGSNTGYTYLWNFGDALASVANPNTSTLQNPKHHYSQQGVYMVSLTVTTPYGCTAAATTKQFTVNGAVPVAGFTVNTPLCVDDSTVLINTSKVDFGNITKLEIFWDYDVSPTVSSVFYRAQNQIPANNIFKHLYADLTSGSHHIKMIASSGESCISAPADQTITVNAHPVITLSQLNSVCVDAGTQQISENKNGFTGTGVFSGTGVSATGLFDPSAAGAGSHIIHYLFTAQTGCVYNDSLKVTVNAKPVITLVATATTLEGGEIKLNPKATGDSLTYQWSPATGVSNTALLNPIFSPSATTIYTLTVTSAAGCTAAAQVAISVLKTPVVPNAFTPNNDGINDTWDIKYLNTYPDATVDIFNRYGAKVYTSNGYAIPWDGKFNGKDLPFGVYYYIINPKSGRKPMTGSLTIIK